jgi:hypothetical protein
MKNIALIFFVSFSLIFSQKSFSQTFGVKAGLNLSNVIFKSDAADFMVVPGFHAGATAEFQLNRVFLFETDLLFSSRGYRESYENQYVQFKTETHYYYLEVPLKAKAFFSTPFMTFSVFAGPYIGLGICGNDKGKESSNGETTSWSDKIAWGSGQTDLFKRLDYGLVFGAGVQLKHVEFSLSYGLGLANIASLSALKMHNRVIEFSAGYKFLETD